MAEKFGIGAGPHELKIGPSFANRKSDGKYHTIRYDFKPASLDPSKKGVLEMENSGESNSLNVKLPHSNGSAETNYSGHIKNSTQKECVLIIDRTTGEITLEKLSGHMLLKKTRQERPEKSAQIEKFISSGSNPSSNPSNPASTSSRPQTPAAAFKRDSPAGTPKPISRSASPHIQNQTVTTTSLASAANVSLSESSSDSSSSGSDFDSDSEEVPPFKQQKPPMELPSMPSFLDADPIDVPVVRSAPQRSTPQPPTAASMPQILNDDLQLSESDEDSD